MTTERPTHLVPQVATSAAVVPDIPGRPTPDTTPPSRVGEATSFPVWDLMPPARLQVVARPKQ